jgi:hypothetical protein
MVLLVMQKDSNIKTLTMRCYILNMMLQVQRGKFIASNLGVANNEGCLKEMMTYWN